MASHVASYDDLTVHELMIKDKPRTEGYLSAIRENRIDFEGKVVLDVGCGTGILSMFAAAVGGAKKVYAVEASGFARHARTLVANNGLADVVTVIQERMEDVTLPEKVDVIISEWMGFYLIHESMLGSVLFARDKWLKDGGKMYPSHAQILLSPVSMDSFLDEKIHFWNNVYGFDFSLLGGMTQETVFSRPEITIVKPEQLLSTPMTLKDWDLSKVTEEEVQAFSSRFQFTSEKEGSFHGFCLWFDCEFRGSTKTISLPTGPGAPDTHWKQTVVFLGCDFPMSPGEVIPGMVAMAAAPDNPRHFDVTFEMGEAEAEE